MVVENSGLVDIWNFTWTYGLLFFVCWYFVYFILAHSKREETQNNRQKFYHSTLSLLGVIQAMTL